MIPLLLFLLTIVIIGAVIYLYFRQEQSKLVPKDKYDEAWNKFYKNNLFETNQNKSNSSKKSLFLTERIIILSFTFVIALLVSILSISINASNTTVLVVLLGSLLSGIMFPLGLLGALAIIIDKIISVFPQVSASVPKLFTTIPNIHDPSLTSSWTTMIMIWLPYIFIFSLGSYVKNRRIFIFIYLSFVALLILNIMGCTRILQDADLYLPPIN